MWNLQRIYEFDRFIPEWVLFDLMKEEHRRFDPIDKNSNIFAYRDVCQFREPDTNTGNSTTVRVYLDVLTRQARMYGIGPEASKLMEHFATIMANTAECKTKCINELDDQGDSNTINSQPDPFDRQLIGVLWFLQQHAAKMTGISDANFGRDYVEKDRIKYEWLDDHRYFHIDEIARIRFIYTLKKNKGSNKWFEKVSPEDIAQVKAQIRREKEEEMLDN